MVGREMLRRYQDMDEDVRKMAMIDAGLNNDPKMCDKALKELGITTYAEYCAWIMDPPLRGHSSAYANIWVEGMAAAKALKRAIIVETLVYSQLRPNKVAERGATILLPNGKTIVCHIFLYLSISILYLHSYRQCEI
jgi:hypothetical protein